MSSSKSSSGTNTTNRDGRVAADGGAIGISSEGNVRVNMVADEAFDLGADAIDGIVRATGKILDQSGENSEILSDGLTFALSETADFAHRALDAVTDSNNAVSGALVATQQAAKSEAGQIGEQLIKMAVPAAAIAFVVAKILK